VAEALEGRRAIVTGASSGIGEATVEALVREGAVVSAGARRRDRLEALAERIGGDAVHVHDVDLTDEGAARSFVEESADAMGGLDILVNNAGVMLLGPVAGADVEHWQRMINVNLLGLLYCTHAALPIMGEGGGGHIVNLSSVAGRTANLGSAVYNMTKWGVVGFSEALRQEVLHANVRVTCVEPGFVDTELQGHNEHPMVVEAIEKMREELGGDVLEAADIADAIVYALSRPPRVAINEVLVRPTKQRR
jgi:NADP-dependent 3-hydroxy acid dehydrogenase YdfG